MVLSISFLEDKHKILLHLSIFYEYQQFFQHRICYKDHLENYIEPKTESNYIFWFKVSSKLFNLSDDLIFGIVYIPPEGSSYLSPDAFDQVENKYRVLSQITNISVCLGILTVELQMTPILLKFSLMSTN
jgi:hypothetical protein